MIDSFSSFTSPGFFLTFVLPTNSLESSTCITRFSLSEARPGLLKFDERARQCS